MKTNTLLMGRIGTGKTKSLETLVNAGLNVRVVALETGIEDVLGHLPCSPDGPALHWHFIKPIPLEWDEVITYVKKGSVLGYKALTDSSDPNRQKYTQFLEVYYTLKGFICDRCGADLGCVDNWSDNVALAIDGLTGLCKLVMQHVVGAKPLVSLGEYGYGQQLVMQMMNMCLPLRCSFILLAHTDRELLHESGQVLETVHAIGQKLAPQLTKAFSEVIWSRREGNLFFWSTDEPGAESKARRLPWSRRLRPDFAQILNAENEHV